MDFEFSEEQQLLKDSVERLLGDKYDFEKRKKILEASNGWSREIWKQYAELGIFGLPFSEDHGGIGGGPVETMIVMSAIGKCARARTLFADRRLVRRLSPPLRNRRAENHLSAGDCGRQHHWRIRAYRAAVALRSVRRQNDGEAFRQRFCARWRQERRAERRSSRLPDRYRARLRQSARQGRPRTVSSSTRKQAGSRAAAIARSTASAPPRFSSQASKSMRAA